MNYNVCKNINDILFREEVQLHEEAIKQYFLNKRILITGGGGSIGSELCRQLAAFGASSIIIFDVYENNAYELYCALKEDYGEDFDIHVSIGSICDKSRLDRVFSEFCPNVVIHAAAHKHVPLMEESPCEAILNNVKGTKNVLEISVKYHVECFVLISTDKAVNPTNIMGASKRIAEMLVQLFSIKSHMKCIAVRFGNVLGSSGSVVPLMIRQIENGGPVRVTHPDITRYFMSILEASQLVLQAVVFAETGMVYVLDMKEPIKIMDLAKKLIELYGYTPDRDMPIVITGLRQGEKLYEELIMHDEFSFMHSTPHPDILKIQMGTIEFNIINKKIDHLVNVAKCNNDTIARSLIRELVPKYQPDTTYERAKNI